MRAADTVVGSGQFIGPGCSGGAFERSTTTSMPRTSVASNGTASALIPLLSSAPLPT
jgi:hypothetical protein